MFSPLTVRIVCMLATPVLVLFPQQILRVIETGIGHGEPVTCTHVAGCKIKIVRLAEGWRASRTLISAPLIFLNHFSAPPSEGGSIRHSLLWLNSLRVLST